MIVDSSCFLYWKKCVLSNNIWAMEHLNDCVVQMFSKHVCYSADSSIVSFSFFMYISVDDSRVCICHAYLVLLFPVVLCFSWYTIFYYYLFLVFVTHFHVSPGHGARQSLLWAQQYSEYFSFAAGKHLWVFVSVMFCLIDLCDIFVCACVWVLVGLAAVKAHLCFHFTSCAELMSCLSIWAHLSL